MSADDVKARFPQITLDTTRRAKLAEHIRGLKWGEAVMLKEQLDGPLPRGQVVSLGRARVARLTSARDAGVHR